MFYKTLNPLESVGVRTGLPRSTGTITVYKDLLESMRSTRIVFVKVIKAY